MSRRYYTRAGAGVRNGASWSSARAFAALRQDLEAARPGDAYLIGFDGQRENPIFLSGAPLTLGRSGETRRPIRIEAGIIGSDGGLRTPPRGSGRHFFVTPGGIDSDLPARIRLVGASNVVLDGFAVAGASADGVVKFAGEGDHVSIHFSDWTAADCGRVIESGRDARVRGLLVERCAASRLMRGFARFRDIRDGVFRDLDLDAAHVDGGEHRPCQLIAIAAGQNLSFERVHLANAVNPRSGYVQGDGLVCERAVRDVTIRQCSATGMGDGGFDLKASGVTMEQCVTERCKNGLRIWSGEGNIIRRCSFRSPRRYGGQGGACVEAHGAAELVDCDFDAGEGASVFRLSYDQARLRIHGGRIRTRAGAPLVVGNRSAVVELEDVNLNGELRSGRFQSRGD